MVIAKYHYNYKLINDAMSVGGEWSDDQTMLIQRTINQPLRRRCQDGILGPVTLTVGVVLGPVLNVSKSFQINCVKRW